ncbi:MAG: CBS domain-containing protein [Nitrososphaerales archaeon]|jgi:hypothetical protein
MQQPLTRLQLDLAFPHALARRYAIVKPDYPLITVLYLLKLKDLAAVPLTSDREEESRAVFGFSSLERLVKMGPKRFAPFLQGPCEDAAGELDCFTVNQDLGELLDSFKSRRLGFALVRGPDPSGTRSLVTLGDALGLYEKGMIQTDMVTADVASPVFSMPESASVREALQEMLSRGYRRIFVSDTGCYISDRSIIEHALTPSALEDFMEDPDRDPLAAPIGKLWSVRRSGPTRV